jgi:predicted CXXCH cytochrome family protein
MAGRTRTTKKLAQRINRDYFKNNFAIPRWRRTLSLVLTAVGVIWLGSQALANREKPYSSGPLASSHAFLGNKCDSCHVGHNGFTKSVSDRTCTTCHAGPAHQKDQVVAQASCSTCHLEHKGAARLSETGEKACTSCHSDLKTRSGTPHVAAKIDSFESGHPEFTPLRTKQQDPGTIKFNHQIHLKKDLRSATGNVQMTCDDCHRTNIAARPWPYGLSSEVKPGELKPGDMERKPVALDSIRAPHSTLSSRSYIEPIDYFRNCQTCHSLMFDKRIKEPAPHKDPATVKAFVVGKLREYIAAHPSEIGLPEETDGRIPPRVPPMPAKSADEWVQRRVAQAETVLWGKTCKECHTLEFPGVDSVPQVPKANLTTRWLTRGSFDHSAHQMVVCSSCHVQALTSTHSSDVMLPGIKVCQSCHQPGQDSAKANCSECHQYHDWNKEEYVEPTMRVALATP